MEAKYGISKLDVKEYCDYGLASGIKFNVLFGKPVQDNYYFMMNNKLITKDSAIYRSLISLIILFCIITPISAQEISNSDSTNIDTTKVTKYTLGGFAGPVFKSVMINSTRSIMIGGHAAFMINNLYGIGLSTYGLVTDVKIYTAKDGDFDLYMGTIGMEFHYIHESAKLLHWTGTLFMGRAEVQLDPKWGELGAQPSSDVYFLLSPAVQFELNITPVLMVNVGVGFHIATGVNGISVSDKDMSGLTISASVAIGWY